MALTPRTIKRIISSFIQSFESTPQLPQGIKNVTIGLSHKNKPIDCYKIGTGGKKILFVSAIHGNEVGTTKLAYKLIDFLFNNQSNFSTYWGAWKYPDQVHVWNVVSTQKITSWFLMVIISFILVAYLKHFKKDVLKKN